MRFWKTSFSHYNRRNFQKLHYFCKLTQSVHPPKSWALDFWKIKFVHIPFFSRAEDFFSQCNTSLRIFTKFHFSIWLNTIHLNEFHIIKRNVKITSNAKSHVWFFQNDVKRPPLHPWALYWDFLSKMYRFSTWRKPSDPSFLGASFLESNIFSYSIFF